MFHWYDPIIKQTSIIKLTKSNEVFQKTIFFVPAKLFLLFLFLLRLPLVHFFVFVVFFFIGSHMTISSVSVMNLFVSEMALALFQLPLLPLLMRFFFPLSWSTRRDHFCTRCRLLSTHIRTRTHTHTQAGRRTEKEILVFRCALVYSWIFWLVFVFVSFYQLTHFRTIVKQQQNHPYAYRYLYTCWNRNSPRAHARAPTLTAALAVCKTELMH